MLNLTNHNENKTMTIQEYKDKVLNEQFIFLDILQESGVTNMLGAAPYLMDEFHIEEKREAREILTKWMGSK